MLSFDAEPYGARLALAVDHHGSNSLPLEDTLVEADKAACGEIIYEILAELGVHITKPIAEALYVAISTDTGCFKYSNTSANTFRVAARLVEAGADGARLIRGQVGDIDAVNAADLKQRNAVAAVGVIAYHGAIYAIVSCHKINSLLRGPNEPITGVVIHLFQKCMTHYDTFSFAAKLSVGSCRTGAPLCRFATFPPLPGESTTRRFAVTAVAFAGTLHFAERKVPAC